MIHQKEIIEIAHKNGIKTKTIDKDWVLGHFLNAFYSFEEVREKFIFKGGTCLRKCYFDDYRFSEDLDFTLLDNYFVVDVPFIRKIIKQAEKISGAKFYFERNKLQKSQEVEQGYEISIKYWGTDHKKTQRPLPPVRWQTSIKLDISHTEQLSRPIEHKPIIHNFSDNELITEIVPIYSISEIISEKLRSLIQRIRPRDIYDLWFLLQQYPNDNYPVINNLLQQKAADKNIQITGITNFISPEKERANKRAWERSLADHLPEGKLPDFNSVYKTLEKQILEILNS